MAVGATEPPHIQSPNDKQSNAVNMNNGENSNQIEGRVNKVNNANLTAGKTDPQPENANFLVDDLDDEENDPDYQCGWFRITSPCLKPFRSPKWALALLCLSSVMQGFIVNGLLNVVISTIEKVRRGEFLWNGRCLIPLIQAH